MNAKSRIEDKMKEVANRSRKALASFIAAGDPDYETSLAILKKLPNNGADIIELGVPFSEPMADGITIQKAYKRSLTNGQSLKKTLKMVSEFRKTDDNTPIILMGYYNPIYKYGGQKFIDDALKSGVDGLLIVDLPPEEDGEFNEPATKAGMNIIRLVTPTSDDKRIKKILNIASGFVYYVSMTGITGMALSNLERVEYGVNDVKKVSNLPVAVGFGIKTKEDVQEIAKLSDIVVVGSAIVSKIEASLSDIADEDITNKMSDELRDKIVKNVTDFTNELAKGL